MQYVPQAPTREQLSLIAAVDPCRALTLLRAVGAQLQVYTATQVFDDGSTSQDPPPAQFQNPVSAPVLIVDQAYDVQTLNANAGSILAGQQAHFNALQPGIDAQIMVTPGMGGGMAYNINPQFQPIQGLARHTSVAPVPGWQSGWLLPWGSQIQIAHRLRRTYTQGELPVQVVWYFYAAFLGASFVQERDPNAAIVHLKESGIYVASDVPPNARAGR